MKKIVLLSLFFNYCLTGFAQTSGGPDAYGYTYKTVDHATSPPSFTWIDIQSIGTQVTGLADDNFVGPFSGGTGFQFYWYGINQFYIGSNGYIAFGGYNIASPFPTTIPLPAGYNDWIAPYMCDLNFAGTGNPGTCYYWANSDSMIVSWIEVPLWIAGGSNQTGSNTFQIILDKTDFSITFNYLGIYSGLQTVADNIAGIENITGTLGLAALIDSVPRDSFAIKFYYPPTVTYSARDGGMAWNINDANGGIFVKKQGPKVPLIANVKNNGNVSIAAFTVYDTLYNPSGNAVSNGSAAVAGLALGGNSTVSFSDSMSPNAAGIHKFRTTLSGIPNDLVPSNNSIELEVISIDTNSNNIWLEYTDGTSNAGGLGWNGGGGGIAEYIQPPIYPVKITRSRYYITASGGVGFHAMIYDDDGPNGTHGTLLDSVFVPGNSITLNQYTNVVISNNVVIDSGGIYLVWLMDGAGVNLGRTISRPISRRAIEIIQGGWSGYRDLLTEDFLMGIKVEYAYPTADFAAVLSADPLISFFDMSTKNPTSWYWEFGDGDTSTQKNPVHTYQWNGNYDVCLTVANIYGSDSVCKKVEVGAIPAVAYFVYDATNIPTVQFTDSSSGPPTNWAWNFDDAGSSDTSSQQHPSYTFTTQGYHNVCLRVSNHLGISAPYCDSIPFAIGVGEFSISGIKLFPNPMQESATIVLTEGLNGKTLSVRLLSITGARVDCEILKFEDKIQIRQQNLNPGSYIVEITSSEGITNHIPLQIQ